jgi:flagellar biosynthesis protein FlhA
MEYSSASSSRLHRTPGTVALDIIGILILAALGFIVIYPLPAGVIDILILSAIGSSFLLLLGAFISRRPHTFGIMPTMALLITLLRSCIYLSAMRLILAHDVGASTTMGQSSRVVACFGAFMAHGGVIPGILVLAVIIAIQILVIARSAIDIGRKIAGFDFFVPQVNTGHPIDMSDAEDPATRQRRRQEEKRADFYGALEGAMKFIRLDALLTVLLLFLAVPAGFFLAQAHGMVTQQAILSIIALCGGNALATTYSGLFVTMASLIAVSRQECLNSFEGPGEKSAQGHSVACYIISLVMAIAGAIGLVRESSLPPFPFIILAAAFLLAGRLEQLRPSVSLGMTLREIFSTKPPRPE